MSKRQPTTPMNSRRSTPSRLLRRWAHIWRGILAGQRALDERVLDLQLDRPKS